MYKPEEQQTMDRKTELRANLNRRFEQAGREEINYRFKLTMFFSIVNFLLMGIALLIVGGIIITLLQTGIISFDEPSSSRGLLIIMLINAGASLCVGTCMAFFFGKVPVRPISTVIEGMNKLADGKYDTRIDLGDGQITGGVSDSFNKMAEELQNTELLRSDFINNFSHEFKTPIVSILGFAKLIKKGNLSDDQKAEYLDIIEEESERLSRMATNVLDMTRIENQTILTDITWFNLSEQIRSAVILLEKKWTAKDIDMMLDFDEHMIEGNVELLRHVWINLVDNAVKFSPEGGRIHIGIEDAAEQNALRITVRNQGKEIPESEQERIFSKFYQSDKSHSTEGNGIGLAIVKRVVRLHCGYVSVQSADGHTTFTVILPKTL